ncbi:MAG: BspA family leucine-rich repeat surface protein [Bacteroides sp.]|nr:BspA family leucine-rich repeat surface protein [Bacteroides sp.]
MKKIIFSTMIASLLAFVGCQNEELVNENTNNGGEKVILTANIQGAADSRVVLTPATDDKGKPIVKVAWNESEETFEVYGSSDASSTFTQIAGTNQFVGTLPESDNGEYEAYYGDLNSLDEQDGKLGQSTVNDTPVLMSAMFDSSSPSITFEHVTAILKPTFKVNGTDIDNSITKIVMSNVAKPTPGSSANAFNPETITITPTSSATVLDDEIYIHLFVFSQLYEEDYEFTFTVTAGGKEYTGSLTIPPGKSIVAGNLYTATIALTEVNACYLPSGSTFYTAVNNFLTSNTNLTQIKFIADPSWTPQGTPIEASGAYMVANENETTLEIRTDAEVFMFHADCKEMFLGKVAFDDTKLASIVSIDFNNCVNTSNVQSMEKMFYNCKALTSLNLSNFDTSNVTTMKNMFQFCGELETLDLSNFVTSKLTNMNQMFSGCSSLTSLNLSSFDTSKVTDMMSMFNSCSSLASLDLSNFDTSSVTRMNNMFSSCSSLASLNLSNFNTSNVTTMSSMFLNCKMLASLDLSSFTLGGTSNTSDMFDGVGSELTSGKTQIYVATPNPFEGKETNINAEYAEYVTDTP